MRIEFFIDHAGGFELYNIPLYIILHTNTKLTIQLKNVIL